MKVKPREAYHLQAKAADGLHSMCKDCRREKYTASTQAAGRVGNLSLVARGEQHLANLGSITSTESASIVHHVTSRVASSRHASWPVNGAKRPRILRQNESAAQPEFFSHPSGQKLARDSFGPAQGSPAGFKWCKRCDHAGGLGLSKVCGLVCMVLKVLK